MMAAGSAIDSYRRRIRKRVLISFALILLMLILLLTDIQVGTSDISAASLLRAILDVPAAAHLPPSSFGRFACR